MLPLLDIIVPNNAEEEAQEFLEDPIAAVSDTISSVVDNTVTAAEANDASSMALIVCGIIAVVAIIFIIIFTLRRRNKK